MVDIIIFVVIAVLVYGVASAIISVVKALYPFRWLILLGAIGIAYSIHQQPSVKTYRRVHFTDCDSKKGKELVHTMKRKGLVQLKSKVQVHGVCNELANTIPVITKAYRKSTGDRDYKVTITSAIDGKHSNNSHHYKGRAFDLRVRDISRREATKIANNLKSELGDEYRIFWGDKGHRDHIHIAYIGSE